MAILSDESKALLHRGFAQARAANHLSMTVEHLMVEMLREVAVVQFLQRCGTDVATLRALLVAKIASFRAAQIETVGTQPSEEFTRVTRRAIDAAEAAGRRLVLPSDLFLAILEEGTGFTATLIRQQTADAAAFDALRRRRAGSS